MPAALTGRLPPGATAARLVVTGLVQGVGFRPWVAREAARLGLSGQVKNTGDGVEIEIHGAADDVAAFVAVVTGPQAPGHVARTSLRPASSTAPKDFSIRDSDVDDGRAWIGADTAVCDRCLDELFDPTNRRHRHPFIHCPRCGPRFTIQHGVPFDRARTSLAPFPECADCRAEGRSPDDRRCHDQTNACRRCGPRLWWRSPGGTVVVDGDDGAAIAAAAAVLDGGGVIALKSGGGFHLVCRAGDDAAVARIRTFKDRPTRPLAVMATNVASLGAWVDVTDDESAWLQGPAAPIVLLRRRPASRRLLAGVAPGQAWLGAMLPFTAVHHLLFHALAGLPVDPSWRTTAWPTLWVVTSANRRGQPLIVDNDEAVTALAGVADGWLLHDRSILARVDDSVLRVRDDGSPCLLRRARGFAPLPWSTTTPDVDDVDDVAVLALGTDLKATVCAARTATTDGTDGSRVVDWRVTPHLGGLGAPAARAAFGGIATAWSRVCGPALRAVACDRHPDLHSARVATAIADEAGVALIKVGHHHAHIAAVMAEHGDAEDRDRPVIGLALDGFGIGDDGGAWGGEVLRVDGDRCERLAHLWPLALPGGDRAAREPWRLGVAALVASDRPDLARARFADEAHVDAVLRLVASAPGTSSLGRLFDAAAALLGGPRRTTFEGEAALWLESLAAADDDDDDDDAAVDDAPPPGGWCPRVRTVDGPTLRDWRPLLRRLATTTTSSSTTPSSTLARLFHDEVAHALADEALDAARRTGCTTVVLGGGCLANRRLDEGLTRHLRAGGVRVWRPQRLPVGDGAISTGQAFVALHRLRRMRRSST